MIQSSIYGCFYEPFVGIADGAVTVGDEVLCVGEKVADGSAVIVKVGRSEVGCSVGRFEGLGVTRTTEED